MSQPRKPITWESWPEVANFLKYDGFSRVVTFVEELRMQQAKIVDDFTLRALAWDKERAKLKERIKDLEFAVGLVPKK